MKIAHVNLAKGFRGGERQTALLIQSLAEHDFCQTLVCRQDSPLRKYLYGVPGLAFHAAGNMFAGHWKLSASHDLFHAHEAKAAHWCFIETLKGEKKYIITRRVPNPLKAVGITPTVYRTADAVVPISRAIESYLYAYDPRLKTTLIFSAGSNLAVDSSRVAELRRQYAGFFIVGHAGALDDKHKGQRFLIQAAANLEKMYPLIRFKFLGRGKDEMMLKKMADGLTNVEFLGFTESLGDYLSVMDLFVFPSIYEGLGSVLIDVLEFGVPVIASNVGGIPDIIGHDKTGILVPPEDAAALAAAVIRLYENPEQRKQFAREGKRAAARFSKEAMGERYRALYYAVSGKE